MTNLPAVAVTLLVLFTCVGVGRADTDGHPQDGPDADIRIEVTDRVVKLSVVLNLAFIDEVIGTAREDHFTLYEEEHPFIREGIDEFLRDKNRMRIDGVDVAPVMRGFEVAEPDLDLLPLFPTFGSRALIKARWVVEYPVKSPPKSIAFHWSAYPPNPVMAPHGTAPEDIPRVELAAQFLASGDLTLVDLVEDEPEHVWHRPATGVESRFLAVPTPIAADRRSISVFRLVALAAVVVALVVAARKLSLVALVMAGVFGAAAWLGGDVGRVSVGGPDVPTTPEAEAIFAPLHANIYRAFDYTEESEIYDALARSVDGPLLDRLYNEVYQSLVMREEGGAVARVERVTPETTTVSDIGVLAPDDTAGFRVDHRWRVDGMVHHWGHSHSLTNVYRADYTVRHTVDGWRIADSRLVEQARVDSKPGAESGVKGSTGDGVNDENNDRSTSPEGDDG